MNSHVQPAVQPAVHEVLEQVGLVPADLADVLQAVVDLVRDEIDVVIAETADESATPIPEIDYDELSTLADGPLGDRVRRRGCVVVRGTFDADEARQWDAAIGEYLDRNHFDEAFAARHPDAATRSGICGIYWSKPQVEVRQHDRMHTVRTALNGLWRQAGADGTVCFDPEHDVGYPDRVRRRAPGVTARGLRPHVDSPSAGGWRVPENLAVFADVLAGRPEDYDAFDAAHRTGPGVDSPVGCSVFRTFQGWTALSETRPSDGGLSIVPIPMAVAYLLVAGLAREVGLDGAATPAPRRVGDDPLLARARPDPDGPAR